MAGSNIVFDYAVARLVREPHLKAEQLQKLLLKQFPSRLFPLSGVRAMIKLAKVHITKRKTLLPRPKITADGSTDNLLVLILRLASTLFPTDKLVPGVVLAYLPSTRQALNYENRLALAEGKHYYASFIRYPTGVHDKLIMFTAFGVTPNEAIREIGLKLQSAQTLTADLRDALMSAFPKFVKFSGFDLGGDLE